MNEAIRKYQDKMKYKVKIFWTAKGIVDYLNEEIVLGRIIEEFGDTPDIKDTKAWEKYNAIIEDVMKSIKNQIN
mgnify:CR=1 FL=1|tara:strand:- start:2120 stop:2341 length:222 start_codon:yes stop_codon:yes gene_type:complete